MLLLLSWLLTRGFFASLNSSAFLQNVFLRVGPVACVRALPVGPYHGLYEAFVCGIELPAGSERQLFIDTGLIHVMVVSGSHLVFLEALLGYLSTRLRLFVLGVYCFLVGFQAPVVRAFLRRLIGQALTDRLGLSALQIEAATVVVALAIYPPWLLSRSFLMSWMCGLAMCAPPIFKRHPNLDLALKCYFFLLPFCWGSPISIFWNVLLAPTLGIVLFPACVAAVLIPPLHWLSDGLWWLFLMILHLGPRAEPLTLFLASNVLWWLPAITHIILLISEVQWRRAHAFSYS